LIRGHSPARLTAAKKAWITGTSLVMTIKRSEGIRVPDAPLKKGVDHRGEPGDDDQEADPLNRAA
jgi:hypothetical protein